MNYMNESGYVEANARIPVENLEKLYGKVKSINRICSKHDIETFTLTEGERSRRFYKLANTQGAGAYVDTVDVKVTGQIPRLPGYELIGIKRKDSEGFPLVFGNIPENLRDLDCPSCDICGTRRNRNEYAVLKKEQGNLVTVGLDCFSQISTETNPEMIIQAFQFLEEFDCYCTPSDPDGDGGFGSLGIKRTFKVRTFLACVAQIAEKDGYVSRQMAEDRLKFSTAEEAMECYNRLEIAPQYEEMADKIIEHCLALNSGGNEFLYNLKVRLSADVVGVKNTGFIAAAYAVYQRHLTEQRNAEIQGESEYIGSVGDRIDLELTFQRKASYDSMYGTTMIYVFTANNRDSVVWKTSSYLKGQYDITESDEEGTYTYREQYRPEPGDVLKVKAKISSHEIYRDNKGREVKTTYLNRPTFISFVRNGSTFELKK